MEIIYPSYCVKELESLIARIHPPEICVDNDTCEDCTLIKVDSVNKNGILLEMVQVLTDLDLVISKSYISSDGDWFMDVFHVTDQLGNKLTDESIILYIKQALCATRMDVNNDLDNVINAYLGREVRPGQRDTAIELTGADRPGLMSEIAAVLLGLGCNITAAEAWTHNSRAACIVHVENGVKGGPISDLVMAAHIREQLQSVMEAHHSGRAEEGRSWVRLSDPIPGRIHTQRRLHQLMYRDGDYEQCRGCNDDEDNGGKGGAHKQGCDRTHVRVERCEEKEYWVVNVRSRDRPKLLFDTICALTDLDCVVFHAAVASTGHMADQEYFVRYKYECSLEEQLNLKGKLKLCLIAAIERRISHGLRLDLSSRNQMGMFSDITRVFRENGLSMTRIEIATREDRAFGSIYVTDTSGNDVNREAVESAIREIGGSIMSVHKSADWVSRSSFSSTSRSSPNFMVENRSMMSLGSLIWSRLSTSFKPVRS